MTDKDGAPEGFKREEIPTCCTNPMYFNPNVGTAGHPMWICRSQGNDEHNREVAYYRIVEEPVEEPIIYPRLAVLLHQDNQMYVVRESQSYGCYVFDMKTGVNSFIYQARLIEYKHIGKMVLEHKEQ